MIVIIIIINTTITSTIVFITNIIIYPTII
jgi:hypothetical protein